MKKKLLVAAVALSFFAVNQSLSSVLRVTNNLVEDAHISVTYLGFFCTDDKNILIKPGKTWSTEAGACLITKITPSITAAGKTVYGLSFESSGTGDRTFSIEGPKVLQQGNQFGVVLR